MDLKKNYGYFGPESMFWRIWREQIQLLGGSRSIILQLSHPLIAAGVKEYSNFQKDPIGRLNRTVGIMSAITFGSKNEADEALKRLQHVHTRVHGYLPHQMGKFRKNTFYNANDSKLKLWVHATLIDTGLRIHQLFVGPLSPKEKEQFYKESQLFAHLMGIPKKITPKNLKEFTTYMANMYKGAQITPTKESKRQVKQILNPNIPLIFKPGVSLAKFITKGLLPKFLQRRYGLNWKKGDELMLKGLAKLIHCLLPLLPGKVRFSPKYKIAQKAVKLNSFLTYLYPQNK